MGSRWCQSHKELKGEKNCFLFQKKRLGFAWKAALLLANLKLQNNCSIFSFQSENDFFYIF